MKTKITRLFVSALLTAMPAIGHAQLVVEGNLLANLQSVDLNSNSTTWDNQTSATGNVGNFTTVNGNDLNVATLAYGSTTVFALNVNSTSGNAVQSALSVPLGITGSGTVSVEAWIYSNDTNPTNAVANYGVSNTRQDRDFNYDTSGHGALSANFDDASWTPSTSSTPTTLPTGSFEYVTYTYDGTNLDAYLNGVLENSTDVGGLSTAQTILQIGTDMSGDAFHGDIAAFRLEDGLLTQSDITQNYDAGLLATTAAPEPSSLALVGLSLSFTSLMFVLRRKHRVNI